LKFLLTICLSFLILSSSGQIKVDAKATGKHAEVIDRGKELRETAQLRKEQARQIREQLKAREAYKQQYDSLKSLQLDTLEMQIFTDEDSVALANKIVNELDFPEEYKILLLAPIILEQPLKDDADSVALAKAMTILEEHAKAFLPVELDDQGNLLKEFPANPFGNGVPDLESGMSDIAIPSKPNPNVIKPDEAKKLFEKINPEQFKQIQTDVAKLKRKYSVLPDTRYPEKGTKRNSIEDVPFAKRLYFGGNVGITSSDPLILDNKLQMGYWINKKWIAGIGGSLREQFSKSDSTSLTGDAYGFSLFTQYDVVKGFFGWVETERQINKSLFQNEEFERPDVWQKTFLVGIGREYSIGPVQMMSMILYDLNYRNNNLNPKPIIFKIGVRFSKKPE
jgi:hypothetical protein